MRTLLVLCTLGLLIGPALAAPAGDLAIQSPGCRLRFDGHTGALLAVEDARTSRALFVGPAAGGWWKLAFQGGASLASDDPAVRFSSERRTAGLVLRYQAPAAEVTVTLAPRGEAVEARASVRSLQGTALTLTLPRVHFPAAAVQRFYFPDDLGIAFRSAFFLPQDVAHPTGWDRRTVGGGALAKLVGHACKNLPDQAAPVPVRLTDEGRAWLADMAQALAGRKLSCNRPPDGKPDLALVESDDGVYLPGYRLGGKGYLFRLSGIPQEADAALLTDLAARVTARASAERLAALGKAPAGPAPFVAILDLQNGPRMGGWTQVGVSEWTQGWRGSVALRRAGLSVRALTSLPALYAALKDPTCCAVLNPYAEWLPSAGPGRWQETLSAVGDYVRAGGVWWETGGYSFHYEMVPRRYYHTSRPYPDLFSDFIHLDAAPGRASIYRAQPARPGEIFVPATLRTGAVEESDPALGYYEHDFNTYVRAGETWQSPALRFGAGRDVRSALADYGAANEFRRGLAEKVKPAVLERLKQSVLLKLQGGTFAEQTAALERLPSPTLVHLVDYLHGGFDKQYPDHVPPHPAKGTPEQLRALYDRAHALGHLVTPYTNPTWWCDDPPGPTFVREGDAPLVRTLDGKKRQERYSTNIGWSTCLFHPAVVAVNRLVRKQMTEEYPSDLLFQDQVGARSWLYDTNPASPTPYAYTEGILRQAEEDSRVAPLGTENGFDRLINAETMFCGVTWSLVPTEGGPSWRRYYHEGWADGTWEFAPLALWLAHDKALFAHHDLGQFVTNAEALAWTLGIGYHLSYATSPGGTERASSMEWLRWLDRLQKSVSARYSGQPLTDFAHVAPGVMRSVFGPVTVVANTTPEPYTLSPDVTVAGHGFYATAQGMRAGFVTRIDGQDTAPGGLCFVEEQRGGRSEVWTFAAPGQSVALSLPGTPKSTVGSPQSTVQGPQAPGGRRAVRRFSTPTGGPAAPPVVAPARRAEPPKAIGIISPEPAGAPSPWVDITPEMWREAFEQSGLAGKQGLKVELLRTPAELRAALTDRAGEFLAIVNPQGEAFLCAGPEDANPMLARIRAYVEGGGIWWETGGYSFHTACWPPQGGAATWGTTPVGASGLDRFGVGLNALPVEEPAAAVQATPLGREWLGAARADGIGREDAVVNRGAGRQGASAVLVEGANGPYIAGHRLGAGWLWRVGGFRPNPRVALPAAVGACEYLWDHVPALPATGPRKLEHYVVAP